MVHEAGGGRIMSIHLAKVVFCDKCMTPSKLFNENSSDKYVTESLVHLHYWYFDKEKEVSLCDRCFDSREKLMGRLLLWCRRRGDGKSKELAEVQEQMESMTTEELELAERIIQLTGD